MNCVITATSLLRSCRRCQQLLKQPACSRNLNFHVNATLGIGRNFHDTYRVHHVEKNCGDDEHRGIEGNITEIQLDNKGTITNLTSEDNETLAQSFKDIPGTTNTKQNTLAIIYTCVKCNTRSAKQFTEHAYRNGVVMVKCPGCQNLHLIADRLGWFEDMDDDFEGGWDIEKALARAGENVTAVTNDNVLEMTLEDVVGSNENNDK